MKFLVVLACLLAVAYANEDANVLKLESQVNVHDFKYTQELDNSAKQQQEGHLEGDENWVVSGAYEFISPEGEKVAVSYTADENGYRVNSANPPLPTSPPIPEAIQRSLDWIAAHPPPPGSK